MYMWLQYTVLLMLVLPSLSPLSNSPGVAPGGRGREVSDDCEGGGNAYSATVIEQDEQHTIEQEGYPYEVPTPSVLLNSGAAGRRQQQCASDRGGMEASVRSSHDYEEVSGSEAGGGGCGLPMHLNRAYRACVVAGYRVHINRVFLEEAGGLKSPSHDERTRTMAV